MKNARREHPHLLREFATPDGLRFEIVANRTVPGAVVHVYSGGKGYEVEFLIGMKSPAVITLKPADIERIPNA